MKLVKFIVPLVMVGCLLPNTALAGGTLGLDEIMPLIRQSKKLTGEVNAALKKTGQKANQINCVAVRLGNHFEPLSAYRVAPFDCRFASNKFLHIEAKNLVRLPNDRTISLEDFLDVQPRPNKASLVFRLQSWQWTTSE
ncbi:hypothetical protein [Allocoleopsis sp.]|uniref:hypothetical protein n=1 Tax=Allocoleopsis sp. TaxID=3088169 RepID=UPI002FD6A7CB